MSSISSLAAETLYIQGDDLLQGEESDSDQTSVKFKVDKAIIQKKNLKSWQELNPKLESSAPRYLIILKDGNRITAYLSKVAKNSIIIRGSSFLPDGFKLLNKDITTMEPLDKVKVFREDGNVISGYAQEKNKYFLLEDSKNTVNLKPEQIIKRVPENDKIILPIKIDAKVSPKRSQYPKDSNATSFSNLTAWINYKRTVGQLSSIVAQGFATTVSWNFGLSKLEKIFHQRLSFYAETGYWHFAQSTNRIDGFLFQAGPSFRFPTKLNKKVELHCQLVSGINYEMINSPSVNGSQATWNLAAQLYLGYRMSETMLNLGVRYDYNYSPKKPLHSVGPVVGFTYFLIP